MPIYFESQGPPIHGQCGADYRPSENYAIDSGLKPFVVELKFDKKGELIIIFENIIYKSVYSTIISTILT